jgi:acetyltransferase-like isoleucine patch superfamily enzyme
MPARSSPLARLRNLIASARVLSTLDAEAREALRLAAEQVADENVRARQRPHIDPTALISPFASLRFTDRVEIGPRANLGPFCAVWGGFSTAWVRLGPAVHVGTGAALLAGNHAWEEPGPVQQIGMNEADVICEEGSVVSANSIVIGSRLGRYSLVGANSVVIEDVPDYAIVVGAPARVVGHRPAA